MSFRKRSPQPIYKMKKKRCYYDSDSEDFASFRNMQERKVKKVMPRSLAEEIDAEAEADGAIGLQIDCGDNPKSSLTKTNIREIDLERSLYRWYERYQQQRKEVSRSNTETPLKVDELMKKAKNLVQRLGGSSGLMNQVTRSWIIRWQERYGVPKSNENVSDASSSSSCSSLRRRYKKEREEFPDSSVKAKKETQEERTNSYLEPIKQRLKKRRLINEEENEVTSSVKSVLEEKSETGNEDSVSDYQPEPEKNFRQILTIDTGHEPEVLLPARSDAMPTLLKLKRDGGGDVKSVLQDYGNDQIYFAFCFELDWKSLPDRTLEMTNEDPVWVLMACNRSGRHRTRILVTGRHWRPPCLKHVNMLSQPVVYAGGGKGVLTPDLFTWWLKREFMPAAESLNSAAVLVAEERWVTPKTEEGFSLSQHVKVVTVTEDTMDWNLVLAEFRTRYTTLLLRNIANVTETTSSTSVIEYLNEFTLKDAFPLFHKSWLSVRSESFQRFSDLTSLEAKEDKPKSFTSETISASLIQSALNADNGLINLTSIKGEESKIKEEFQTINLTLRHDAKDPKKPETCCHLALTKKENVSPPQSQEDRMLLLELQWLAHDIGLEVTDEDLSSWALESKVTRTEPVKTENEDSNSEEDADGIPSASEAADHLGKALLWMETQPLEPSLLMILRDIIDVAQQASKMGLAPPHPSAALQFFCHNGDHLTQPPPAHMGIPPYQLDAKGAGAMGEYWRGLGLGGLSIRPPATGPPGSPVPPHPAISPQDWKRLGPLLAASGLSRTPMYPFSTGGTYPYPMLSPDMSQVASWHTPGMYPISAGPGFRSPYPTSLPISSTTLPSDFYRFSPTGLLPGHPGLSPHGHHSLSSHPAIVTPGPKQELGHHTQSDHNHRSSSLDHKNSSSSHHSTQDSKNQDSGSQNDKKKPHIKKPLNAFMLYMKEMRAKVVAECTLKESAAINQILGRRWHALGREEQAKYYELARRERQLHMQLYPDWSSRANSSRGKKRKRKQEANDGGNNMKKCRARYGLDQQSQWCKPCRRKKKCIRYLESGEERDGNQSEDNLGSCGSVGEAKTPPDDDDGAESLPHSLSSPGGLSGLSSLTSPSMILPSPSTSLASPSVSLASPCMSLQSPLTPPAFDIKPIIPIPLPPLNRNPVGTNPHDVNNPLSVNQLTGKCIKSEPKEQSRPISVT